MKEIAITTINPSNKESFYCLAKEYLPYSDYEKVMNREKEYSKAYVALMTGNEVIGVAFGWPRRFCSNGKNSLTQYKNVCMKNLGRFCSNEKQSDSIISCTFPMVILNLLSDLQIPFQPSLHRAYSFS